MSAADLELVRRAWDCFGSGDLEGLAALLDPRVRWVGADAESPEDGCHDRGDALDFIRRTLADGVTARALAFHHAGDRVVVEVQTQPPPEWGERPEPHAEVVCVRAGLIAEIVVHPTVAAALAAAAG